VIAARANRHAGLTSVGFGATIMRHAAALILIAAPVLIPDGPRISLSRNLLGPCRRSSAGAAAAGILADLLRDWISCFRLSVSIPSVFLLLLFLCPQALQSAENVDEDFAGFSEVGSGLDEEIFD